MSAPIKMDHLVEIARLAGVIIRDGFKDFGMKREIKADTSPVTEYDKLINRLMIDKIRAISAEVDIIGEEGSDRNKSEWQIVCDPIDGTMPYVWGMPISTFMIGLLHKHKPVMGLIYDPFMDRRYNAGSGEGAWMNNRPLKVSTASKREDNPVVGYVSWPGCPFNILKACQYLEERGVTMVHMMSIGYMDAMVANGEFAATLFPAKHFHDTVQGHIIVEEAGGKATDVFGQPLDYSTGKIDGHIFSNGHIHDLVVEAVKACN